MGIDAGNEGRRLYEIEDKKFLKKLFLKIKNPDYLQLMVIMPFKYTDGKENSLYAWRAFSYGKKIEIFC